MSRSQDLVPTPWDKQLIDRNQREIVSLNKMHVVQYILSL
jgi:hypothetical protein